MKKQFYLLTAGLLLVCIVHAQITKGDVLLGGNVNFNRQTGTNGNGTPAPDQTTFGISPSIGKAVADNLLVGLNLSYFHTKANYGGSPANISTNDIYGLGVFVRKYKNLGAGFALFAEGDLSGNYQVSNNYTDGSPKPPDNKSYSVNAGFYPGIAYFISKHCQLETGIQNLAYVSYGHARSGADVNETKTNSFSLGTSFNQALNSFVIGLKWLL